MNPSQKLHRIVDIAGLLKASADGKTLPSEIQLLQPGNYRTVKGDFTLTPDDFEEAVVNFGRGVARVAKTSGLPINFNHVQSGPAGCWMNGLENRGAEGLWATNLDWTKMGIDEVGGGNYKFFSIEYWFSYYEEPDEAGVYYNNVVEGGAFTNIPLMRKLTPVMADKSTSGLTSSSGLDNIYLEQGDTPVNLDQLKLKANAELSTEERKFIADHKDQLSNEEQVKFGLVADKAAEEKAAADKLAADKAEAEKKAADEATKGQVSFSKEEADKLRADAERGRLAAEKLEKKEVEETLQAHVKRGAIKPDSVENWSKVLLSAPAELRTQIESQLDSLSENKVVASGEVGGDSTGATGTAQEELHARANDLVKASKEAGTPVKYADAVKELLADKDLSERITAERQAAFSN